ncbi:MAG: hypothetical protein HPY71_06260 [Firmicutes bacterium]|nr:hypothetical protein [Bacillota bacterium]
MALLGIAAIMSGAGFGRRTSPGRIIPGVSIAGVDVGGRTAAEAREMLGERATAWLERPIILEHQEQRWHLAPGKMGISPDIGGAVARALATGRTGGLFRRMRERREARTLGIEVPLRFTVDEGRFRAFIANLRAEIDQAPRDAVFVPQEDGTVEIEESSPGARLDASDLPPRIQAAITRSYDRTLPLTVREIRPGLTTGEARAMGIRRLLGSYQTVFDPGDADRVHNIATGAAALNGYIIPPSGIFSFNKVVGPRSEKMGYRRAPVVLNQELVPDIGGGICQVSTTLYNAVLLAGLEVVARSNHSLAPAYVPPGRDATVAYDYLDFKFKNTTGSHILVTTAVEGNVLKVRLFGTPTDDLDIVSIETEIIDRIEPGIIEKEDRTLKPGEKKVEKKGAPGYVVKVWRVISRNGLELRRDLVSVDQYDPRPTIVRIGVGGREPADNYL